MQNQSEMKNSKRFTKSVIKKMHQKGYIYNPSDVPHAIDTKNHASVMVFDALASVRSVMNSLFLKINLRMFLILDKEQGFT